MNHDIDIKKVRINCFRQSKVAGEFMLQMRVPGAMIEARHLSMVQELCERYGNGTFHMGTRQTLDVPGIKYENIEAVNKFLKGYIHDVDVEGPRSFTGLPWEAEQASRTQGQESCS